MLLMTPAVAKKVTLLWPTGTVALPGTESNALLLESATFAALAAGWLKVTTQVLDALLARVVGPQVSDVSCVGPPAVTESVKVWETPLKVAVSMTL